MSSRFIKESPNLNPTQWKREGPPERVEVSKVENLYSEFFAVNRYSLSHDTFGGGKTPIITREVFERGHAVCVLPYDPVLDRLIFIEQFRAGAMVAGWHPWLMEVPAGMIEHGEAPEDVARRETLEETGLAAGRIKFIGQVLCTPGGASETLALYCTEVDSTKAPETAGLAHEHEDIRVFSISATEALEKLETHAINNGSTLMVMQWFALHHTKLRGEWLEKE